MAEQKKDSAEAKGATPPVPEPDFRHIVETLAVAAMVWTGQIAQPDGKPLEPNLEMAKYQIGLLEILQRKTKGNLEKAEEDLLAEMLHAARLAFVRAADELKRKAHKQGDAAARSTSQEQKEGSPKEPGENKQNDGLQKTETS